MKLLFLVCLALLPPLTARAETPVRWVTFTDPTDGAFTVDVPAGWTVVGGITHRTRADFSWYVTAVSPDGMITLRIGDPQIGVIPVAAGPIPASPIPARPPAPVATGKRSPAKSPTPTVGTPGPYETGADFAVQYGKVAAAQLHLCDKPKIVGAQEEPNPPTYTEKLGRRVTTGDAFLLCIDRGYIGYVIATTVLAAPPAESWDVPWLAALEAPVERRAEAMGLLHHMSASWSFAAGWIDKLSAVQGPLAGQMTTLRTPSSSGDRARWESQVDTHDATALRQIDTVMNKATAVCEADTKMPAPHQCGETGHLRGQ